MLSHEALPEDRLQTLRGIHRFLVVGQNNGNNNKEAVHQYALDQHNVDYRLCWQLSYELQQQTQTNPNNNNDNNNNNATTTMMIGLICECLSMLWGEASMERRQISFAQLGDYLPWFIQAWTFYNTDPYASHYILSIFQLWAKVKRPDIKARLIHSGLVPRIREAFAEVMPSPPTVGDSNRGSVLTIIKDLSIRSKEDDKCFLYQELKEVILKHCIDNRDMETLIIALTVLWNLAVVPRLCYSMGQDAEIWSALKAVCTTVPVSNDTIEIHQHLSSIIGTIVAERTMMRTDLVDDPSPPEILLDQSSWLVPHLVGILRHHETDDTDTRRRCMRLLRCLAGCEWGRLPFLWEVTRAELMAVLIQVVRKSSDGSDTRSQACQTVSLLLPWAIEDWASQTPCLETALIQTITDHNTADGLVLSACRALLMSLNLSPWKRGPSCFSPQFFEHLSQVLKRNISEPPFHIGISKLLLHIIQDGTSSGQVSTLAERHVLDSVALLMTSVGPDFESPRANAIEIITIFMNDDESKKPLAENDDLLSSLVNFCLITSGPQKDKVKQMILKLVPEL